MSSFERELTRRSDLMPILTLSSHTKKLGPVAATYAPVGPTCAPSCPLLDSGCYAQYGRVRLHAGRIASDHEGASPLELAELEARELEAVRTPLGRPLRLHVSGDCRDEPSARRLAAAVRLWRRRGGGVAWTYTHSWREIPRDAWGPIEVLASCESLADARSALEAGYAPALVVDSHATHKAVVREGLRLLPCPEQTRAVTCAACQLCWRTGPLRERRTVITFAAHGQARRRVLAVLDSTPEPSIP